MTVETQAVGIQHLLSLLSKDISETEKRISSGLKVAKASDNPADYVISEMMNKTISGLSTAKVNVGNASNLVSVAEGGLKGIKDLLGAMRATALTASDSTKSGPERSALSKTIVEQMKEIDDTVRQTTWGGRQLLNGAGLFNFQTGPSPGDITSIKIDQSFYARETGVGATGDAAEVTWETDADGRNAYITDYSEVRTGDWTIEFTSAGTYNVTSNTTYEPPEATGVVGSAYSDAGIKFQLEPSGNSVDYAVGDRVTFGTTASVIHATEAFRSKGSTGNAASTAGSAYVGPVDGKIQINLTGSGNATVISGQDQLTASFTFTGADGSQQTGTLSLDSTGKAEIKNGSWDSGVTMQFSDYDQMGYTNDFVEGDSFSLNVEAATITSPDTSGVIGADGISLETANASATSVSHIDRAISIVEAFETLLGSTSQRLNIRDSSLATMVENNTAARDRIVNADIIEEQLNLTRQTVQQQAALTMFVHANQQMQLPLSVLKI